MRKPFDIEGPALISFSGGRTSAFMLRRILDIGLQPDVHVVFADTGKERPETYRFVRLCARRWSVKIHWVRRAAPPGVTPFEQLISDRGYLPNPLMRMCTSELKIRPMKRFMVARGHDEWVNVVGIRADEPRRVARLRVPTRERWTNHMPLFESGVTESDVLQFWKREPFDLELQTHEGNCDLCFLKTLPKRLAIMGANPDLVAWWAEQERRTGQQFLGPTRSRVGEPTYASVGALARAGVRLPLLRADPESSSVDCICHD